VCACQAPIVAKGGTNMLSTSRALVPVVTFIFLGCASETLTEESNESINAVTAAENLRKVLLFIAMARVVSTVALGISSSVTSRARQLYTHNSALDVSTAIQRVDYFR